jgi:hypothetical protein
MFRLLDMVGFYVGYVPDVGWIFPSGISAPFSFARSFVVFLARILLGDSHSVQIKMIIIPLCEPKNGFMPATEPLGRVLTMTKGPHNPISELKLTTSGEYVINDCIQGNNAPISDITPDLPAKAGSRL